MSQLKQQLIKADIQDKRKRIVRAIKRQEVIQKSIDTLHKQIRQKQVYLKELSSQNKAKKQWRKQK